MTIAIKQVKVGKYLITDKSVSVGIKTSTSLKE